MAHDFREGIMRAHRQGELVAVVRAAIGRERARGGEEEAEAAE
jgi:hypothetical protein